MNAFLLEPERESTLGLAIWINNFEVDPGRRRDLDWQPYCDPEPSCSRVGGNLARLRMISGLAAQAGAGCRKCEQRAFSGTLHSPPLQPIWQAAEPTDFLSM